MNLSQWRRAAAVSAVLALATGVAVVAGAGGEGKQKAQGKGGRIYWGAHIGQQFTGAQPPWDMNAATRFESLVGKKMSLLKFGLPWRECSPDCQNPGFPTDQMDAIRARGDIPVIDWASYSYPNTSNEPDFRLSEITGGAFDDFLRSWASAAKAWGHPFFLRFDWEMNIGGWTWSEISNGNEPGQFVPMWQHVHDVFESVGADNVNWVWCPNNVDSGFAPISSFYPGDGYVDWVCMDGYNWGKNPSHPYGWDTFEQVFGNTYSDLRQLAPTKPIMIGETASSEYGGSKASWITDGVGGLTSNYPAVKAFLWFEAFSDGMDWPVETSKASTRAFSAAIAGKRFATAKFASLTGSKIAPLSPLP